MEARILKEQRAVKYWTSLETYLQAKIDIENRRTPRLEIRLTKLARKLKYIQGMKENAIRRLQNLETEIESEDEG